jgi:predicted  nucleic acid-binding Zn-ribbon protein
MWDKMIQIEEQGTVMTKMIKMSQLVDVDEVNQSGDEEETTRLQSSHSNVIDQVGSIEKVIKVELLKMNEKMDSEMQQMKGEVEKMNKKMGSEIQQIKGDMEKMGSEMQQMKGEVEKMGSEMQQVKDNIDDMKDMMSKMMRMLAQTK